MYATVVLSPRQGGIANGLTYRGGPGLGLGPGSLVRVPLRKRIVEGIVIGLSEERPEGDFDVKEIVEILGDAPLLSATHIALARWMAEHYLCTLRQAIQVFLPGLPWSKLLPEREEWVKRVESEKCPPASRAGKTESAKRLGRKQAWILEFLEGKDWILWKEVQKKTRVGRDVLKRLVERGLVETKIERIGGRGVAPRCYAPTTGQGGALFPSNVTLTPRQTAASKAIEADPRPTLLFGITGSGKTEIYAALIRDAILEGKSVMLLLPEILLTENFIGRFERVVTREAIAVVHSRLSLGRRREAWRRIRAGAVRLVIGSRSALFSPMQNLGLIILDEEHEWTYKNEQTPRYHARTAAEVLCRFLRTPDKNPKTQIPNPKQFPNPKSQFPKLVLGSATPSLESWHTAKSGKYQLVELPERYGSATLPSVRIIDLAQVPFGKHYPFSPALLEAIHQRLERKEQCVLFLNRRGFATSLICLECRHRLEDPVTKLPYTVHHRRKFPMTKPQFPNNFQFPISNFQAGGYLLSHHTGEELPMPSHCPRCGSARLREVGAGTERVEATLQELFPRARILRADADTLRSPEHIRVLLGEMQQGKADILLGTQVVVKGLDLPGVTLAAVLLADVGLSLPHFRAGERVFQLLTQLAGRSGRSPRAESRGEVIIQTFRPEAMEVALAAAHDVRGYLERELEERRKAHYPPDTELVRIVFSGPSAKEQAKKCCALFERPERREAASRGGAACLTEKPLDSLALAPARARSLEESGVFISRSPTLFSGGREWQVLLRGKNLREVLRGVKTPEGVVDVDPVECL